MPTYDAYGYLSGTGEFRVGDTTISYMTCKPIVCQHSWEVQITKNGQTHELTLFVNQHNNLSSFRATTVEYFELREYFIRT